MVVRLSALRTGRLYPQEQVAVPTKNLYIFFNIISYIYILKFYIPFLNSIRKSDC